MFFFIADSGDDSSADSNTSDSEEERRNNILNPENMDGNYSHTKNNVFTNVYYLSHATPSLELKKKTKEIYNSSKISYTFL